MLPSTYPGPIRYSCEGTRARADRIRPGRPDHRGLGVVTVEHPDGEIGRSARFVRPGHFILDLDTEVMTDPTDPAGLRRLATQYSIADHPDRPRLVEREAGG